MIILRQRQYTRQDQKVIREVIRSTNGLRELPKNMKLHPRDYYRIENLNTGLEKGKVDWDEFKVLAQHLGLPETAKGGQHLLEKYTNPELIKRWKSIKAHKGGVGKEWKRFEELTGQEKELKDLVGASRERVRQKRIKLGKDPDKARIRTKEMKDLIKFREENKKEYKELREKLSPVMEVKELKLNNKKRKELFDNTVQEAKKTISESEKNPEVAGILKKAAQRRGIEIKAHPKKDTLHSSISYETKSGRKYPVMYLSEASQDSPSTIAHEIGHANTFTRFNTGHQSYEDEKMRRGNTLIGRLVNEYQASTEGAALLKKELRKSGYSEEEIEKVVEKANHNNKKAFMTYYTSGRYGPLGIRRRVTKELQTFPKKRPKLKKK